MAHTIFLLITVGSNGGVVAARANEHYGQCPPLKNKLKEETMRLIYNSKKHVNFYTPACFIRHSGVQDLTTSHFVDLGLVRKHLQNDVIFGAN